MFVRYCKFISKIYSNYNIYTYRHGIATDYHYGHYVSSRDKYDVIEFQHFYIKNDWLAFDIGHRRFDISFTKGITLINNLLSYEYQLDANNNFEPFHAVFIKNYLGDANNKWQRYYRNGVKI